MARKYNFKVATNLVIMRDGKVLLMRRQNTGWNDGNYALLGGHVEDGENVFDAAAREANEEIGIVVKKENLKPLFVMQIEPDYVYFYFGVEQFDGEPQNMEPDKCDDFRFFAPEDFPENVIPTDKKALSKIFGERKTTFDIFGWGE